MISDRLQGSSASGYLPWLDNATIVIQQGNMQGNMGDGHAFMRFVLQPDLIDD